MTNKIRILIVEDHSATLEGLSIGLGREADLEVVGTSENSDEGLALSQQTGAGCSGAGFASTGQSQPQNHG